MSNAKNNTNEVTIIENEKWLTVTSHPSYEISNLGRLRSNYKNGDSLIIQPQHNGKGDADYQFYKLSGKKYYVHQLVLTTFIGETPKGYECDHIDTDKTNNKLSNLRYLTVAENRSHKGEAHGNSKLTNSKVILIRNLYNMYQCEGINQRKLAALFQVSLSAINNAITRKTWSHV